MAYVSDALRRFVIERARCACEYCLFPNAVSFYPHEVDHVVALKHQGKTTADNLAYACRRCNRFKGRLIRVQASLLFFSIKGLKFGLITLHSQKGRSLGYLLKVEQR